MPFALQKEKGKGEVVRALLVCSKIWWDCGTLVFSVNGYLKNHFIVQEHVLFISISVIVYSKYEEKNYPLHLK